MLSSHGMFVTDRNSTRCSDYCRRLISQARGGVDPNVGCGSAPWFSTSQGSPSLCASAVGLRVGSRPSWPPMWRSSTQSSCPSRHLCRVVDRFGDHCPLLTPVTPVIPLTPSPFFTPSPTLPPALRLSAKSPVMPRPMPRPRANPTFAPRSANAGNVT